jgi:hypothetical protein
MAKQCYNGCIINKPKGLYMSDNAKFVAGIVIILAIAVLGFVLIAAYFDVLVK